MGLTGPIYIVDDLLDLCIVRYVILPTFTRSINGHIEFLRSNGTDRIEYGLCLLWPVEAQEKDWSIECLFH